jgi:hypothetical protein
MPTVLVSRRSFTAGFAAYPPLLQSATNLPQLPRIRVPVQQQRLGQA